MKFDIAKVRRIISIALPVFLLFLFLLPSKALADYFECGGSIQDQSGTYRENVVVEFYAWNVTGIESGSAQINWGDGTSSTLSWAAGGGDSGQFSHTYPTPGPANYTITCSPKTTPPSTIGSIEVGGSNPPPVYGCTVDTATNYNPSATVDDGSCEYGSSGGAFACAPQNQTVQVGNTAVFYALNGDGGVYNWSSPDGTPAYDSGNDSYGTVYSTPDTETVEVENAGETAQCFVTVQSGPVSPPPPSEPGSWWAGYVFYDTNLDGNFRHSGADGVLGTSDDVFDATDYGIAGRTVQFKRGPGSSCADTTQTISTTVTDATGYFAFTGWSGGITRVQHDFAPTYAQRTNDDSVCIDLQANHTHDFGVYTPPAPFLYSLSKPSDLVVTKSGGNVNAQNSVTKTLLTGTSEAVLLTLSSGASTNGVSYSVSNNNCFPTCTSTITLTIAPSATVGTRTITVTGQPGNKTTNFNLTINGAPVNATCSANPIAALLGQTVTWTAVPSGGTAPYTYEWSGTNFPTPAPTSNPYNIIYGTVGKKTGYVTITDADGEEDTCDSVDVYVNFNPLLQEF